MSGSGSRLAVVTGGSRGIGRAVARLLASRGSRVVVVSRDLEAARAAVASLEGGDHVALSCDVSQEQEVKMTFDKILKTCGKISYLVNSAGINKDGLLLRQKASDMRSLLERWRFIRTDMTAGLMQESAAQLLSIPLGRVGEVEEVAQAAVFLLLSPYVTGQALVVDGGVSLHITTPRAVTSRGTTTLHTTSNTTADPPPPTKKEVVPAVTGAGEQDGRVVLNAGLVAVITIMCIGAVLILLVLVSRSLGLLQPPFEQLDNMP
ncbi:hypothetical protein CRUP_024667, partial [Coryphaenoides rupestris]